LEQSAPFIIGLLIPPVGYAVAIQYGNFDSWSPQVHAALTGGMAVYYAALIGGGITVHLFHRQLAASEKQRAQDYAAESQQRIRDAQDARDRGLLDARIAAAADFATGAWQFLDQAKTFQKMEALYRIERRRHESALEPEGAEVPAEPHRLQERDSEILRPAVDELDRRHGEISPRIARVQLLFETSSLVPGAGEAVVAAARDCQERAAAHARAFVESRAGRGQGSGGAAARSQANSDSRKDLDEQVRGLTTAYTEFVNLASHQLTAGTFGNVVAGRGAVGAAEEHSRDGPPGSVSPPAMPAD
jgi:hypothetical protein